MTVGGHYPEFVLHPEEQRGPGPLTLRQPTLSTVAMPGPMRRSWQCRAPSSCRLTPLHSCGDSEDIRHHLAELVGIGDHP